MKDAIANLIEQCLSGSQITKDQFLWGFLLIGLTIAGGYLVTMLLTRYGDSHPTSKALIFSVMLHASTFAGVVVLAPDSLKPDLNESLTEEEEEGAREVLLKDLFTSEEQPATNSEAVLPWEKPPESKPLEIVRTERPAPDFPELTPMERQEPTNLPDDWTTPDNTKLPMTRHRDPLVKRTEPNETVTDTINPLTIKSAVPQLRTEYQTGKPSPSRRVFNRDTGFDNQVQMKPQGNPQIFNSTPDPHMEMSSIEGLTAPEGYLKREQRDLLHPRKGPEPTPITEDTPGVLSTARNGGTEASGSRFNRTRIRTGTRNQNGSVESFSPGQVSRRPGVAEFEPITENDGVSQRLMSAAPRPTVVRPNFEAPRALPRDEIPAVYKNRDQKTRQKVAQKLGATNESEAALERALAWLARTQSPQGHWDASAYGSGQVGIDAEGINRRFAGRDADAGVTGLAVLAFLGAGYTHEEGKYKETVEKALRYLISQQRGDGHLGANATHYAKMYCHGMATYALAEAYAMSNPDLVQNWLKRPVEKAVSFLLSQQHTTDGGWRYIPGQKGDMSMFGWQLMALKSAERCGIPIPNQNKKLMLHFLNERSLGRDGGLAAYRPGEAVNEIMTAEALYCKQMFKIRRDHPSSRQAVQYLLARRPRQSQLNLYYWYYGSLAMWNYGGSAKEQWYTPVREILVSTQKRGGSFDGSWDPRGPWGRFGGRVYSTALGAMCLEVYRFKPIYSVEEVQSQD